MTGTLVAVSQTEQTLVLIKPDGVERRVIGEIISRIERKGLNVVGPLVAAVVEGPRAIAAWRQLAGGTDPVEKATPGTIRGDFGLETQFNLVHGSDSPESAAREIKLWFPGL